MKKFYLFLLMLISFMPLRLLAQTDTAFWFAAPEVANAVYNSVVLDRPIILTTISYERPVTITISQPAGGGMPTQVFTLPANSTKSLDLTAWIDNIETRPGNSVVNKGLKITATGRISVYYEVNAGSFNPEVFTLKGRNALGIDFWISSQYSYGNQPSYSPLPYSSFNIVATENNTVVNITPSNNIIGHAAGMPFTITLAQGQSYAAIAAGQAGSQHLHGSHVTSNKPIAITLSDDEIYTPVNGFCADIGGDQTVPVNIIGDEYIVVKGNLNFPADQLYIMAVSNGTTVWQDGLLIATLNAGNTFMATLSNTSTYIKSDKPVYVYQLSGLGCEIGTTVLPALKCNGSTSISFRRTSVESLYANIVVEAGGRGNFLVNNAAGYINASDFTVVPGTAGKWYAARVFLGLGIVPQGNIVSIKNTSHVFHLGFLQGGSTLSGTSLAYFSDFAQLTAIARSNDLNFCTGNSLQLYTDTVIGAKYEWFGPAGFNEQQPSVTIQNLTPANSGTYILKG